MRRGNPSLSSKKRSFQRRARPIVAANRLLWRNRWRSASRKKEETRAPLSPTVLPLLPIRDQVYFPHMIFPLLVGREKSVRALEDAAARHRHIFIVAQKNLHAEDPDPDDIYEVGIVAEIMQVLRVPDGTVRVMLEGLERCRIVKYLQTEPFYRCRSSRCRPTRPKTCRPKP